MSLLNAFTCRNLQYTLHQHEPKLCAPVIYKRIVILHFVIYDRWQMCNRPLCYACKSLHFQKGPMNFYCDNLTVYIFTKCNWKHRPEELTQREQEGLQLNKTLVTFNTKMILSGLLYLGKEAMAKVFKRQAHGQRGLSGDNWW